jgi:hypothetical protein
LKTLPSAAFAHIKLDSSFPFRRLLIASGLEPEHLTLDCFGDPGSR